MKFELSPAQQKALDGLMEMRDVGNLFVLFGGTGTGKSTILAELHRMWGGALLTAKSFIDASSAQHPLAMDETFVGMAMEALFSNDCVIIDDLHVIGKAMCCNHFYPRMGLFDAALLTLATYCIESNKKLVFANDKAAPDPIHQRALYSGIPDFRVEDYQFLCRQYLGETLIKLDCEKVYRFAPKLNAHQIANASTSLKTDHDANTDRFIERLRTMSLISNVHLDEVQSVDIHELKGVDDVIQSLEANIILPLENGELAAELDLKPKRGVLLVGHPGTGKTTVGRALAHRLRSKFFLLDGTFIAGTRDFYQRIHQLFENAKQNAPSIIFIDDTDAIFETGEELGLYRYLLTMLDGLESESAGRVCIMMTAMDVGHLPPALVRSGRIELWLEMRLPNEEARTSILKSRLNLLPAALANFDTAALVEATEGFTGADLKRLVEDGKALFAYDKVGDRPLQSATEYFLKAAETVRINKERYASSEAQARQQRPVRPHYMSFVAPG